MYIKKAQIHKKRLYGCCVLFDKGEHFHNEYQQIKAFVFTFSNFGDIIFTRNEKGGESAMLKSEVRLEGGIPRLFVEGVPETAIAYTTYFEERSAYRDFYNAGYRIFFVNLSLTALPINSHTTGFTPFRIGAFEDIENPDFSEFEYAVNRILSECPDAIIFPRIYISMPRWWVKANPDEVVDTPMGGRREILFSEVFRKDGRELLLRAVRHISDADYSDRIGGWQICGGLTQEWFHHNLYGSICPGAEKYYRKWLSENYGTDGVIPAISDYIGEGRQNNENARTYSLFCNKEVAKTVDIFAEAIKRATNYSQVVGSFYGYSFQSNGSPLFGTHGLSEVISSKNIDFFSSPNAYSEGRRFGIDWADMMPVDSVTRLGKLSFIECDIRTHLTCALQEVRPGEYPNWIYRTGDGASVWVGPPTRELSVFALRKCFAHQITRGSSIWWFDMWGGWYDDPILMKEISQMKRIYDTDLTKNIKNPRPRIAFFADEEGYANHYINAPEILAIEKTRTEIGRVGTPLDFLLVEDMDILSDGYAAAVFPFPYPSEKGMRAMELCKRLGIPYICASGEHHTLSTAEVREFLRNSGIHLYTEDDSVIYEGRGYIGLHSDKGGKKRIKLSEKKRVRAIFGAEITKDVTDEIVFDLEENGTALFKVT